MTRTGELMVGMTARVMARMMELRTRVMQLLMKKSSCQSFHSEPAKEETGSEGTPAGTPTAGNGRNPEVLHGARGALALKGAGGWTGHDSFPADGWLTNPNQIRFPGEPRPRVPPPAPPLPRSHLTASYPTQPPTQAFSYAAGGRGRCRGRCRAGRLDLGPPPLRAAGDTEPCR